ncbi:MAG: Uma2 family endonuclease [Polyangiaceae bacterium]|nr:Uma2 family endonuclease [Polyangiaceae bacterium]
MSTVIQPQSRSVEEYLESELLAGVKHEYLAGQVLAMGGASDRHGLIVTSLSALLLPHARSKGCQLFSSDMKVRIDHQGDSWFYYPDLVLSCDPSDRESPHYRRNPCLLVEVLSPSTEHIDSREKLLAYRLIPRLREYLMLRQDHAQADLYQRGEDGRWQHLRVANADDVLRLSCLDAQLSLQDIYADLPEAFAAS